MSQTAYIHYIMDETEGKIQKYLTNFAKYLPWFVNEWKEILQNVVRPVHGLVNQTEQMRHVESDMKDNEELLEMQQRLLYKIYNGIEEEILIIKDLVNWKVKFCETYSTLPSHIFRSDSYGDSSATFGKLCVMLKLGNMIMNRRKSICFIEENQRGKSLYTIPLHLKKFATPAAEAILSLSPIMDSNNIEIENTVHSNVREGYCIDLLKLKIFVAVKN